MNETRPALGIDLALSNDMMTNGPDIVLSRDNDGNRKSGLCAKVALETMAQAGETASPKRGRGRPTGPSLRMLLTQTFSGGATPEMLIGAGFGGDLAAALRRKDIKEQHGRYVWVAVSKPEVGDIADLPASLNLLAPEPPVLGVESELPTEPFRIEEISLDKIKVGSRRRTLDQAKVDAMMGSMGRIGLQTPITVYQTDNDEFELGPGLHRHAAAKLLGWRKILCRVVQMDDLSRQLWEIDENLCRAELNELEHCEHLAARKAIYEQLHPETRNVNERGGPGRGIKTAAESASVSFTADTATKTGLSERTIQQSIYRAEHIAPEVRDVIRDMPQIADKGVELDQLARATPEQQATAVSAVKRGEAPDVRAALQLVGSAVLPPNEERSLRIPRDPKKAAAYLIGRWPRADLEVMHSALGEHLNCLD